MEALTLQNRLKAVRAEKKVSQGELAEMVGVSRLALSIPMWKKMRYTLQ